MQLTTLPLSALIAVLPYLATVDAQSPTLSDSLASSLPSDQLSQSSSACPCASSTPPTGLGIQEFLAFLNNSGYTALSSALEQANGAPNGQQWISQLGEGNWTVFAPTNDAFTAVPQNVSSNATTLADYLSYHFVHGDLSGPSISLVTPPGPLPMPSAGPGRSDSLISVPLPTPSEVALRHSRRQDQGLPAPQSPEGQPGPAVPDGQSNDQLLSTIFPNTTVARTTLNASEFVQLEGGRAQVLAWTRFASELNATILNQLTSSNQNVTAGNTTHWNNLFVAEVNSVLVPPGPVAEALAAVTSSDFVNFVGQVQLPDSDGTNASAIEAFQSTEGFTLFAPSTSVVNLNQTLQGIDQANIATILMNHYINGSTIYSPTLRQIAANSTSNSPDSDDSEDVISAGGQSFSFTTNSTGLFVSVGNDTIAQVVQPDVLVKNGVIHVIDRLLFQSESDTSEASAAVSSYSSAAATETNTETIAIIFPYPSPVAMSPADQSATSSSDGASGEASATPVESAVQSSTPSTFRIRRGIL